MSLGLSVGLALYLSVWLSFCLSVCLSVWLAVWLSGWLAGWLYIRLFLSISRSLNQSLSCNLLRLCPLIIYCCNYIHFLEYRADLVGIILYIQYRFLHSFGNGKRFFHLITLYPCNSHRYFHLFLSTDAAKKAVLAAASVTLFVVPTEFVLSSNPLIVPHLILSAFFILTPIINHFRMLIAIRQHGHQVADAVASNQQRNMILRREKKVAMDMFIVAIVLLISFAPSLVVKSLESSSFLSSIYPYLFPWAVSAAFMNSYVNPVIYFWRNKELRIAMKSAVTC